MENGSTWDRRPRQDIETGLSVTTEKAGWDSRERVGKGWKRSFSKAAGCKSGPRDGACRHGGGGEGRGHGRRPSPGQEGRMVTPDRGGGRGVQACGDAGKGEATGPGRMVARDPAWAGEKAQDRPQAGARRAAIGSAPAGRARPYQLAGLLPVTRAHLGPTQTPSHERIRPRHPEFSR